MILSLTRQSRYEFSAGGPLAGFDPADSDKLIVTLSHERGEIKRVTYGGVRMSLATEVSDDPKSPLQRTSIYYLDSPETTGNLVVEIMDRPSNGVGGSLIAVSNVAMGEPVMVEGRRGSSLRLSQVPENALIVASHACNDNREEAGVGAATRSPLAPLFNGPTGSSAGGSGYHVMGKSGPVTVNFKGTDIRPVTAAAVFVSGG